MKIKVSEATPVQLDWLVAKREGLPYKGIVALRALYNYSTDWAQGGPIIEREFISINELACGLITAEHPTWHRGDVWIASKGVPDADELEYGGPTPLIAAMRCYVASTLGDEVDVPEELV